MNLIFLTMSPFDDLEVHNIYADLLKEFVAHGHRPYLVSPVQAGRRKTGRIDRDDYTVLRVRVGSTGDVSLIKKGISTVLMEGRFIAAVRKFLSDVRFSLILYSTPPVTFAKVIRYLKKRHDAPAYLLLKDIFPQNAVDLGMFREGGLIHKYFRGKEKALYALSDHIGCMSQANVDYLLKHNPEIEPARVCVCPNSIAPNCPERDPEVRAKLREHYNIPQGAIVFMYGGNMGKPQDIPFVIECLRKAAQRDDCFFVLCGTGSEYPLLERYVKTETPANVLLINGLPKAEYDALLQACDVGLLFLDHRFTIPNFPSRMLSYMEQSMPILACTDPNTDVGKVIADGGFGWWCESNDAAAFANMAVNIVKDAASAGELGKSAKSYLERYYSVSRIYNEMSDIWVKNDE